TFVKADISGAAFRSAELISANFNAVRAAGADFREADLTAANLRDARLERSSFREADLSSANLVGAILTGSDFTDADLSRAQLRGADLSRAKGLTQDQLDDACSDGSTRLPKGLVARCNRGTAVLMIKR